jgi:pyruvate dehydrogenase E2 component (dihydrolipoamide acetyltransferase)
VFAIAKEFKFPDVGEGIHEGVIVKWHAKEGDKVEADKTIVEVETDKAVVELPAPYSGTVLKVNFKQGDTVKVGQVLVVIGEAGEKVEAAQKEEAKPAAAKTETKSPQPPSAAATAKPGRVLAAPSTRRLARELDVDMEMISGSGPGGRIMDDDVRKAAGQGPAETPHPAMETKPAAAPHPAPQMNAPEVICEPGEERIRLSHMRKIIADRMLYSKTHIPHACGMDFVDVTKLVEIRQKEKAKFAEKGVKLTYLPFIMKAAAIALKQMPDFNAHFDMEQNFIVRKKRFNIGLAVDTPDGLMVPVVKDLERKSMISIASEIETLASQARERKIKLDDLKGGTFTITNVGSVGGMYSSPIINPPEVAILGVHRIKDLPLVVNGQIVARKVMGISLCFDHRVVDGAAATEFMNIIKRHLEDPDLLLVDMS